MARKNEPEPDPAQEPTFESRLADLEEVVRQLEAGDKPLDASLDLYERGVKALKSCHEILNRAERRLKLLVAGPDGKPALKDLATFPGATQAEGGESVFEAQGDPFVETKDDTLDVDSVDTADTADLEPPPAEGRGRRAPRGAGKRGRTQGPAGELFE
ncbi:MAG: exodeoxyribonuclease VII small subunit [Planctomycetota bacterium]|nr:exodeoxyribonuclease VII small subunit [Planctomycetota bacterium]